MAPFNIRGWIWGPLSRFGLRVAGLTLILDQAHKWLMLLGFKMTEGQRITVTPFFDWYFVLNKGVSYSFLTASSQAWQYALAAFALAATVAMAVWLARSIDDTFTAACIGLVMGGALGNGLDRLTLGGVADFFSLHAAGYYWYVFNIADVAIVAGVAGLLYESLSPSGSLSGRGVRPSAEAGTDATKPTQIGG